MTRSGDFNEVLSDDHVGGFQLRGRRGLMGQAKGPREMGATGLS